LAIWIKAAGHSEFSARYLSVLLGLIGVPIVMQLGRALSRGRRQAGGRTTGLGGALAYATLPIFVYYSQEVRMYALAVPLTAGFLWAGWRLVTACCLPAPCSGASRRPRATARREAIAYVTLGLLMLTSHLYTGLAWLTTAVWGTLSLLISRTDARNPDGACPTIDPKDRACVTKMDRTRPTAPDRSRSCPEQTRGRIRLGYRLHRAGARQAAGAWVYANLALAILALPIAVWALWRMRIDATAVSAIPAEALRFLPIIFGVGQYLEQPWSTLFVVVTIVSVSFTLATLLGLERLRSHNPESAIQNPKSAGAWFLLTLTLPVVVLFLMTTLKAKWSERYLLPSWGIAIVVAVGTGWELLLQPTAGPRLPALLGSPASGVSARGQLRHARLSILRRGTGLLLLVAWLALVMPALARQSAGTWAIAIQDEWHPKPDFRGVARFIEAHGGPDDAIAVVGGYAASAVSYYYHGEAHLFGLPYGQRVLDTRQAVDLHDLEVLQREAGAHQRLWLVLWQHHLADPTNLIQSILVEHCRRLPIDVGFVNVNLLLFDLETCRPLDRLAEPEVALTPVRWREAPSQSSIALEGYQVTKTEALWEVSLWWRTTGTLDADYTVFVHLVGPDETIIAQHDHIAGADAYPTSRWRVGTRLRDRFFLDVPEDLRAPDFCEDCSLRIGLYTPEGRLRLLTGSETLMLPIP
jgi:hypothetical protein